MPIAPGKNRFARKYLGRPQVAGSPASRQAPHRYSGATSGSPVPWPEFVPCCGPVAGTGIEKARPRTRRAGRCQKTASGCDPVAFCASYRWPYRRSTLTPRSGHQSPCRRATVSDFKGFFGFARHARKRENRFPKQGLVILCQTVLPRPVARLGLGSFARLRRPA